MDDRNGDIQFKTKEILFLIYFNRFFAVVRRQEAPQQRCGLLYFCFSKEIPSMCQNIECHANQLNGYNINYT